MLKNRVKILLFLVIASGIITGCGEYEKILKSRDYAFKYKKAKEYYETEEFVKAATLFDQVVNIYRGTIKADTVKYYQAKSYYGQRDYILSGHYFGELASTYLNSVYVEESEFMVAYCYYKQSPRSELDQEVSYQAINSLKMYMMKYPTSGRLTECQELINELGDKIVDKSFISARLYFDLGYFKAAIIALRSSLEEYPETQFREELMFLILKSSYLLADGSIESKKTERFQSTVDEYLTFNSEFPESEHQREAEKMYRSSKNILEENTKN
jgi:outer membrane protein assembly factor BamD